MNETMNRNPINDYNDQVWGSHLQFEQKQLLLRQTLTHLIHEGRNTFPPYIVRDKSVKSAVGWVPGPWSYPWLIMVGAFYMLSDLIAI
jgi:hypothetical protein